MKNHRFMGITGCLKNLFGLMPAEPYARRRHYYHHLVRMPYMLADPFLRDRSAIRAAEEAGFGTTRLERMDFQTEVEPQPPGTFYCDPTDSTDMVIDWRRTMCEQALEYRDNRQRFQEFAGQYVLIRRGEVKWHSLEGHIDMSRRELAGSYKNESLFLKFVDPEEREEERFEVYERALQNIKERGL